MICENSSSGMYRIVSPQCWKGKVSKEVTVTYNEVESDTLRLCAECAKDLKKDARRLGYAVSIKSI